MIVYRSTPTPIISEFAGSTSRVVFGRKWYPALTVARSYLVPSAGQITLQTASIGLAAPTATVSFVSKSLSVYRPFFRRQTSIVTFKQYGKVTYSKPVFKKVWSPRRRSYGWSQNYISTQYSLTKATIGYTGLQFTQIYILSLVVRALVIAGQASARTFGLVAAVIGVHGYGLLLNTFNFPPAVLLAKAYAVPSYLITFITKSLFFANSYNTNITDNSGNQITDNSGNTVSGLPSFTLQFYNNLSIVVNNFAVLAISSALPYITVLFFKAKGLIVQALADSAGKFTSSQPYTSKRFLRPRFYRRTRNAFFPQAPITSITNTYLTDDSSSNIVDDASNPIITLISTQSLGLRSPKRLLESLRWLPRIAPRESLFQIPPTTFYGFYTLNFPTKAMTITQRPTLISSLTITLVKKAIRATPIAMPSLYLMTIVGAVYRFIGGSLGPINTNYKIVGAKIGFTSFAAGVGVNTAFLLTAVLKFANQAPTAMNFVAVVAAVTRFVGEFIGSPLLFLNTTALGVIGNNSLIKNIIPLVTASIKILGISFYYPTKAGYYLLLFVGSIAAFFMAKAMLLDVLVRFTT